tara:strand:+ start:159 stop:1271 length:1113 start_codon:yes stop_codon:yes gene_type:complete
MKIAIVHDWLEKKAGAEKVLEEILKIYPKADLFVIVDHMNKDDKKFLSKIKIKTSFVQFFPFSKNHFRKYLFFFPLAVKLFNLKKYDIIISSSHSFAKNIDKKKNQLHICYCHTPSRYTHVMTNEYLNNYEIKNFFLKFFLKIFLFFFAKYDIMKCKNVDYFIANSNFIRKRIKKIYNRNSKVIYPSININNYKYKYKKKNFFLTSSRLVPYKKIDLIINAFNLMPEHRLIVCGDGPCYKDYKKIAKKNIELKGWVSDKKLREYLSNANAFIFAALEDFGIIPIEAMASGTPVIALNAGGTKETVSVKSKNNLCGELFKKQNINSIISAVKKFERKRKLYKSYHCKLKSKNFSNENFQLQFQAFLNSKKI